MKAMPTLIVDLHTHLFNARCMPLAGVFAKPMNKDADQSLLARSLAALVNRLTESGHLEAYRIYDPDPDDVELYAGWIAAVAAAELIEPFSESLPARSLADAATHAESLQAAGMRVLQGDLYEIIADLERVLDGMEASAERPQQLLHADDLSEWAKRVVANGIRTLQRLAVLKGDIENYAAFVFNMLHSEEHMLHTLVEGYGPELPPMQFVHHMMDMQMAYVTEKTTEEMVAPKYPYAEIQLERMRTLARQNHPHLLGFAAFDPRRENWQAIATRACEMGFRGFKFYPAMGYLPYDDPDPVVRKRVADFFDFCLEADMAVFTHCTPVGFETRQLQGPNADPLNWEKLLSSSSRLGELRLCFGHAGGGDATHGSLHSTGWFAKPDEWTLKGSTNYAVNVARLCRTYPNAYCEFAYISELIEGTEPQRVEAFQRFSENLGQAMDLPGGQYKFGDKIAFGTDWHMPSVVRQPRVYLDIFLRLFDQDSPLAGYRERFFWRNAYRYLKLG